ncbi:MAG: hypothetical protein ACRYGR_05400 [Janthinobacterium lividum]
MKKNNFIAAVIAICLSVSFGILKASLSPENENLDKTNHSHIKNETDIVHAHPSNLQLIHQNDEEYEKIKNLKKFIINNLFSTHLFDMNVNDKFLNFRNNAVSPLGSYSFSENQIILSIMCFLENAKSEVDIKISSTLYQNLKFKFLHCTYQESEKNINLSFDQTDCEDSVFTHLCPHATDTLFTHLKCNNLANIPMYAKALYKIAIFKIDTDFYRFNVQLFAEDIPGSNKYLNKKNSNFLLNIQHI